MVILAMCPLSSRELAIPRIAIVVVLQAIMLFDFDVCVDPSRGHTQRTTPQPCHLNVWYR